MSVSISNMIQEVRSGLQEPTEKFYSGNELIRWINYALQMFARETKCLKSASSYSWVADTAETLLSTVVNDSSKLHPVIDNAEWTGGTTSTTGAIPLIVSKREVQTLDRDQHITACQLKGTPNRLYYEPYAEYIGLYPVPDTAGTLKIYYTYDLSDYSDGSQIIASAFDPYWIDIAAYPISRGMLKDIDRYSAQEATLHYERFKSAISKCKMRNYREAHPHSTINFVRDYEDN